ncbi:hypothetical protein SLS62_004744 [Diatrype stigma]|uniref:RRM domain-containing protein n=1 Tax=Diatrype stigma TaxID=117547 RepID=A0AAN9UQN1_9PEZI
MADPQQGTPPPGLTFPTEPSEFDSDERISFSRLDNKFIAVHDDGTEFEFDQELKRWIPVIDEELVRQQQSAYGGPLAPEEEDDYPNGHRDMRKDIQEYQRNKKRKKLEEAENGNGGAEKKQRPHKRQQQGHGSNGPKNTAVYVTGLPLDATAEEVHEVFSRKCGVVAEEIDSGRPRIKLYADEQGRFKGDALVVFFKPQSVDMAIMLLDDTDFRYTPSGLTAAGRMRVQAADSSYKKTKYDNTGPEGGDAGHDKKSKGLQIGEGPGGRVVATEVGSSDNGNGNGNGNNGGSEAKPPPRDHRAREQEKQKIIKRTQKLDAKLADWDDDADVGAAAAAAATAASEAASQKRKGDRLVVLRHMFTLEELEEDPAALLEIKEDVRDECSKLGPVTNVVLYDGEPEGVVAVKFRDPDAAQACVRLMDGRAFDGRIVRAAVAGAQKLHFRRSDRKQDEDEDADAGGEGGGDKKGNKNGNGTGNDGTAA